MRNARPKTTHRQIETATDDLDSGTVADEALTAAEFGYPVFELPEDELAALSLAEFEAAITPVDGWVFTLPVAAGLFGEDVALGEAA